MHRATPLLPFLLLLAACAHGQSAAPAPPAFDVRHAPVDEATASQIARVLPGALQRVERWGAIEGPIVIRVHASHAELAASAGRTDDAWLRAWARRDSIEIQSPRTWTRGRASDQALATLLAHELTHCLLFQRIGPRWMERRVPAWFEEGLASFTAGETHLRADAGALRPSTLAVRADAALAYGTADRAFRLLVARHGEASVRDVLTSLAAGRDFPSAFEAATGTSIDAFEGAFRSRLEAIARAP